MKKQCLRFASILLTVFLLAGAVPVSVLADEEEYFPDNNIAAISPELNTGGDIAMEDEESEYYEDEDLNEGGEIVFPEDSISPYVSDDEELGAGGEIFPENAVSPTAEAEEEELGSAWPEESELTGEPSPSDGEDPEEGEEELNGVPKIVLSQSAFEMNKGNTTSVTVFYTGYTGKVFVTYGLPDKKVSASWGSWKNSKIPLNIKGLVAGSTYVYVFLKSSADNTILAYTRIAVSVVGAAGLTASANKLSIQQGTAGKVSFTVTNATGSYALKYSTTNTSAYSCQWGSWTGGTTMPMTITGKATGTGTVTVYLVNAATGATISSCKVTVNISGKPKLTASPTSINVNKGSSVTVKLTKTNFSGTAYIKYGTTNSSLCSVTYGNWSGSTIPVTVTGKTAGTGTLTFYLYDAATDKQLTSVAVKATLNEVPTITPSESSFSMESDKSKTIKLTVAGVTGSFYTKFGRSPSTSYVDCAFGSWSGKTIPLTITGKNAGVTIVQVNLYSKTNDKLLASTQITVTTTPSTTPKLTASPTSLSIKAGNMSSVKITYSNLSVPAYLEYSLSSETLVKANWGDFTGNTIPLTVEGLTKGKGTITIYIKREADDAVLASVKISVEVTQGGSTIKNLSYKFSNFSEAATLSLCQYFFGNTAGAKTIYYERVGEGGNCFGFSSSAGILYAKNNGIYPSTFNSSASAVSDLNLTDRNSSLGLTVKQLIMGMQLTQCSTLCSRTWVTESNLGSLISNINTQMSQDKPVLISVRGSFGGHAILAIGTETVSSTHQRILVYDNNYPLTTRYIDIYKNSSGKYTKWVYDLASYMHAGTDYGGKIGYINYSQYYTYWSKRGKLQSAYNMMTCNSSDFTVYNVNDEVVARVVDGQLQTETEEIRQALLDCYLEGNETAPPVILFMPVRLYTVENNDPSTPMMELSLCNVELGTDVRTTADTVTICADDSCDLTSAMLMGSQGEEYSITLNSVREGDPETLNWSGTAADDVLSVSFDAGSLEVCNLSADDMSAGGLNGGGKTYAINVAAAEHGSVQCDDTDIVKAGQSRLYRFVADQGYVVKDVKIDGTSIGKVNEYTFKNVSASHTVVAVFDKPVMLATPQVTSVTNTAEGIKVAWNKINGACKYRVFYKEGTGGWKKLTDTEGLNYVWKTPVSGKKYTFTVRCLDYNDLTFTSGYDETGKSITYVKAPAITSLTNESNGIKISWGASAGASKYSIYYKEGSGSWKKLADTASTSYTWTGAVNGKTYGFTVRCLGSDGKTFVSGYDNTGKSITFKALPRVNSVFLTAEGIKISWGSTAGVSNYRIFYKEGSGTWKKLTDAAGNTYTWNGGTSGKTYGFTVRGISADGKTYTTNYDNTGKSILYIKTPQVTSVTNQADGIKIAWTASAGASRYRIFYKEGTGGWKKLTDVSGSSYTWTGAASGKTYGFTVRALNAAGTGFISSYDDTGRSLVYVAAPVISSLTQSGRNVIISWGLSAGAAKYRIFYKEGTGGWKKLADTGSTSYTWNGAAAGMTYSFTIRCLASDGTTFTSGYDNTGKSITVR